MNDIMRVGVWSCAWLNNFGDDLMEQMIDLHLRQSGTETILYRPDRSRASGGAVPDEVDRFISSVDGVVIAGGAWLCPFTGSLETNRSLAELHLLTVAAERREVPLLPISIGSNGRRPRLNTTQIDFLSSPMLRSGTFRLRSDLSVMSQVQRRDRRFEAFSDICLSVGRFISADPADRHRSGRVGVNLSSRKRALALAAPLRTFVRSYDAIQSMGRRAPATDAVLRSARRTTTYVEPFDFARQLSSMSCVMTSKLHVGVVALALGVPALSLRGQAKTKAFFDEAGLPDLYLGMPELELASWRSRIGRFDPNSLELAKLDAARHFDFLDSALDEL